MKNKVTPTESEDFWQGMMDKRTLWNFSLFPTHEMNHGSFENVSHIWCPKNRGLTKIQGFPGGSDVKNLSEMQETRVQFLGWEDLLEKETATHSSILAWRIPWTEESGGLQPMWSQEKDTTERLH